MVFVFLAMGLGGWLDGSVTSPYAGVATRMEEESGRETCVREKAP